jgi:hypothetical protein
MLSSICRLKSNNVGGSKLKAIVIIAIIIGVFYVLDSTTRYHPMESYMPLDEFEIIANQTRSLIENYNNTSPSNDSPLLKGKVLTANLVSGEMYQASGIGDFLPSDLIAKSSTEQITLFAITTVEDIQIGRYTNGFSAFQRKLSICVLFWPEKTIAGNYIVYGKYPPSDINPESYSMGEYAEEVADWIESLR